MAQVGSTVARAVAQMLGAEGGLPFSVTEMAESHQIEPSLFGNVQIISRNVSAEISERAHPVKYPVVYVYCERAANTLREKFRTFSGTAEMTIEIRVSNDRIEEMESALNVCVDGVTDVLDRNRGQWSGGMFYSGGYDIHFGAIKHGGRHFLQSAKVKFSVNFSAD